MKAASLKEIKTELSHLTANELTDLCLRIAKFKKENKELLTYLLFEQTDEDAYIKCIKTSLDQEFLTINTTSYFYVRKSMRKILRLLKKYIRYSQNKETEIELLLYYCRRLNEFQPSITKSKALVNLYNRNIDFINKKILLLHEDLQYDFQQELKSLHKI